MSRIQEAIREAMDLKGRILANVELQGRLQGATDAMVKAFQTGGRVLFCGNGGSAADAQHLAAEFSGRFYFDRAPLDSEALHVNTSFLTAVANDYSYGEIYSRLVQAKGRPGDVLVGISTSGNSGNIIAGLEKAKTLGMVTVGMTGETGGKMAEKVDFLLNVPSLDTPRIQECHILLGHIMCEIVEARVFA
jgi:D-sedoheptulose 7-phosphate isomerase